MTVPDVLIQPHSAPLAMTFYTAPAGAVAAPLSNVVGLAFLGVQLHPAGKPSVDRARHLSEISVPMLFLQGPRDALAKKSLMEVTVGKLGLTATLNIVDSADHAFQVLARSGRTDMQAMAALQNALWAWIKNLCQDSRGDSGPAMTSVTPDVAAIGGARAGVRSRPRRRAIAIRGRQHAGLFDDQRLSVVPSAQPESFRRLIVLTAR